MCPILIILYVIGLLFIWFVDQTIIDTKIINTYSWKHISVLTIIWLLSPIFIMGLLFLGIKFLVSRIFRKI